MVFTKVASSDPRMGWVNAELGKAALKSAFGAAVAMGVLGAGSTRGMTPLFSRITKQLGFLLFTTSLAVLSSQKAYAFCNQDTPFGIIQCRPNTGGHKDITRKALSFLRPYILDDIIDEHVSQDVYNTFKDYVHFDNSNFTEAVDYINIQYTGVIAEFNPNSPQPFVATDVFGELLHTAQDFYAHTNWVDYNPDDDSLFDSGTGVWTVPTPYGFVSRGGIDLMVLQGNPPPRVALDFTVIASPLGLNRLVKVTDLGSGATYGGLVGGEYGSGNQAPPGAIIQHGGRTNTDDKDTMNKDSSVRTNYDKAFKAATLQTETEWCRMLNLTAVRGYDYSSIPMALWVAPDGNPHPTSTACSSTGPLSQSVQVSIKSIKVKNDTDSFGAGELNFPFVLYRKDFTGSVRTEANSISVSSGNFVPPRSLPTPLTLGLKNLNDLVITLQAWDDDNFSSSYDGIFDSSDDVLIGITDFFPGVLERKMVSEDLEVCLVIKVLGNRRSQQGESEGCLDFGDAPDSYKTLLESGGPRYREGDFQRLGIHWDDEWNGKSTPLADGDDRSIDCSSSSCSRPVDDEDGVIFGKSWVDISFNISRAGTGNYQLRAWWDTNYNGSFDHLTELYIDDLLALSPGSHTKRYDLGFDPKADGLYSRFRLTWDPLDLDVKPYGEYYSKADCAIADAALRNCTSHGEVEDYVHVPAPLPILGLGAVFGYNRKLRKLLKASKPELISPI